MQGYATSGYVLILGYATLGDKFFAGKIFGKSSLQLV
jgi:hypothetical protein